MTDDAWTTPLKLASGCRSVAGTVRDHNEDTALCEPELGLFAVADGLGGHRAGDCASRLAVEVLTDVVRNARTDGAEPSLDLLLRGFADANERILAEARANAERRGMGTTLTAILIVDRRLLLGHVGDTRAWRVRDEEVEQLTQDHTVVGHQLREGMLTADEAAHHPMRHVLSRCLGVRDDLQIDLVEGDVAVDDLYLLASDGMVPGLDLEELVELVQSEDPEELAPTLVESACARDGSDNITGVTVRCAAS